MSLTDRAMSLRAMTRRENTRKLRVTDEGRLLALRELVDRLTAEMTALRLLLEVSEQECILQSYTNLAERRRETDLELDSLTGELILAVRRSRDAYSCRNLPLL